MNVNKIHRNTGFTLIDALSVIVIIGITLSIGLPSLKTQIANSRLTSATNDMLTALRLTRSEAIKQVKITGIVVNSDGKSWDSVVLGSPNSLIQSYQLESIVTLTTPSGAAALKYRPDGRLDSHVPVVFEFTLANSNQKRILTVQRSGAVALEKIE